jgi:hypothetical protein
MAAFVVGSRTYKKFKRLDISASRHKVLISPVGAAALICLPGWN